MCHDPGMNMLDSPEEYWAGRRDEWREQWDALTADEQRTVRAAAEQARVAEGAVLAEIASGWGLFPRVPFAVGVALWAMFVVVVVANGLTGTPDSFWSLPVVGAIAWVSWMRRKRMRDGRAMNLAAYLDAEANRRHR